MRGRKGEVMEVALWILGGVVWFIGCLVVYCWFAVSSEADREMDELIRNQKRSR